MTPVRGWNLFANPPMGSVWSVYEPELNLDIRVRVVAGWPDGDALVRGEDGRGEPRVVNLYGHRCWLVSLPDGSNPFANVHPKNLVRPGWELIGPANGAWCLVSNRSVVAWPDGVWMIKPGTEQGFVGHRKDGITQPFPLYRAQLAAESAAARGER